jgi:hypothetical protein
MGGEIMRLYFERIDPDNDKFTATIKGDSKVLLDLLDWYVSYNDRRRNVEDVVKDIKSQVENARKKFERENKK